MRSFGIIFNGRKGGLTCLSLTTLVPIHFEWALGLMVHCSLKNAQLNYQLFSFKFNSEFLDNRIMTENKLLGSIAFLQLCWSIFYIFASLISSISLVIVNLEIDCITVKPYHPQKSWFQWICSKLFVLWHEHVQNIALIWQRKPVPQKRTTW